MIYLKIKDKKQGIDTDIKQDFIQAKHFLETLHRDNFRLNDYFLVGADSDDEQNRFMSLFNPAYLIRQNAEPFDYFLVNKGLKKSERLILNGARTQTIMKFSDKIMREIGASAFSVAFSHDCFDLSFEKDNQKIAYTCSYNLEIISSFVYDKDKKVGVDIEVARSYYTVANEILRKQRYYYKNGKNK
jgi:hypothetical protein